MNDCCIIYYHGTDWEGLRGRQQYLMAALSKYVPVVYLDGSRTLRRAVSCVDVSDRITVVRGLVATLWALRRRRLPGPARLCAAWHLRPVRRRFSRVLFWATENLIRPDQSIRHEGLVYDCMDPCLDHDPEYERRQAVALRAAAKVFASAELLAEQCRRDHDDVTLLNNACEPAEYDPKLIASAPRPSWWPQTAGPVAAYLGTIDRRVDLECLRYACRLNPTVQFVIAGKVIPSLAPAMADLGALPNVTGPGPISVSDGRYLLSRCTIGLIPFVPCAMNDAVNPVKMYAYALLGKPMVGTATRELLTRPDVVQCASSAAEFAAAVGRALALAGRPEVEATLAAFASQNTWEHRAALAWETIRPLVDSPPQWAGDRRADDPVNGPAVTAV